MQIFLRLRSLEKTVPAIFNRFKQNTKLGDIKNQCTVNFKWRMRCNIDSGCGRNSTQNQENWPQSACMLICAFKIWPMINY